jgi:hypothetical protein
MSNAVLRDIKNRVSARLDWSRLDINSRFWGSIIQSNSMSIFFPYT